MSGSQTYARIRGRLIELAGHVDEADEGRVVAATPEWSVSDVYRHLVGACDDVLEGRLDGVTTDPWTQAQVERWSSASLPELTAAWTEMAPRITDWLDAVGDAMDPRFFIDTWTHEQDLRSTLGIADGTDDSVVTDYLAGSLKGACIRARRAGLAPVAIRSGDETNQSGDDPVARLDVSPFEFMRGTLGRRSRRQLAAWHWDLDDGIELDPYLDALMVFGMAEHDIVDAQ